MENNRQMKTLAVRQPWAQLIVAGIKDIECRDTMRPRCQKIFIAASGKKDKWEYLSREEQRIYAKYEAKGVLPPYKDLVTKAIIGYVDIVDVTFDPVESIWGADWDGIKYVLRNAMELDTPIYGKNKATPLFYNVDGYDDNHLPAAHKALLERNENIAEAVSSQELTFELRYALECKGREVLGVDDDYGVIITLDPEHLRLIARAIKQKPSRKISDLPKKYYRMFEKMAIDAAYDDCCEKNFPLMPGMEVRLMLWESLPEDLVKLLPEDVQNLLKDIPATDDKIIIDL